MRLGKVKESILKRSVLRQLHTYGQTGSPGYGEDAGFFPVEEAALIQQSISRLIAVSVNPVEGWTLAARRIVYGAVNSLAAAGAVPVLYAGVLSCGVAYTLQVVGQKNVEPAAASLILSLESVVSVLAGWAILGQRLSGRELAGCALVFAAVILVQLPSGTGRRDNPKVKSL